MVAKEGTSCCALEELRESVQGGNKLVQSASELECRLERHRREGRTVVFTNGCFELLHRGHLALLERAHAFGDILVVGLNTDRSVRAVKGPGRPVNALEDRINVLAALSCVDYVVAFDTSTADDLIAAVRPDVYVKGGAHSRGSIPEAPLVERLGGHVEDPSAVRWRLYLGTHRPHPNDRRKAGHMNPRSRSPRQLDVLVPTFERPASLAVTLAGLTAQTLADFRVVISDQSERSPARAPPTR